MKCCYAQWAIAMNNLYGRDLVTTQDWSLGELNAAIKLALKLKQLRKNNGLPPRILERKNLFMLFWAPSTRTRGAFEAGMNLLGGHAVYIDVETTRMKTEETLKDAASMYDLYGDAIGIRILDDAIDFVYGKGRKIVEQIAEVAKIPVINMACCTYHPTQAIGDLTMIKRKLGSLKNKKYAIMWAYSSKLRGRCSIQEELLMATRFGMEVVLAHPPGFEVDPGIVKTAEKNAKESGGSFEASHDFRKALRNSNVVFPRSWVTAELSSIGAKAFGRKKELQIHRKFRHWRLEKKHVNELMGKPAIVTHVLPISRGEEATDEVMDGPNSVIYQQAEDNFYAKMAVLALTMGRDPTL